MSPSIVQGTQISSIALDDANHYLALDEIFVGDRASKYLSEECDLATRDIRKFQETSKNFWITAAKYAISKLPLEDDFLKNLSWIHPHIHDYSKVSEVLIASRLPQVIKEEQKAQLREQFMNYCTSEIPSDLGQAPSAQDMLIDIYWYKVGQLKDEWTIEVLTAFKIGQIHIDHSTWQCRCREVIQSHGAN